MKQENLCRIFRKMPTLETERLVLRPLRPSDAGDMFSYAKDAAVTEYLLWAPHKSVAYTEEYLRFLQGRYRAGTFYDWALEDRESGRMIGTCGFTRFDLPHNRAEIGYVLHPDFHGRGLAAEAALRVLKFGFDVLGMHRIEARYMVGNDASRRTMERIGMTFEGVARGAMLVKGVYRDIGTCAILVSDWRRA